MKNQKLPITLCIIAHNEENIIKDCILKHKDVVSETLVIDQASTDRTADRAREAGAMVIPRRCKGTSDPDRDWLFALASNEWILYLDSDEYASKNLKKKLKQLIKEDVDIYWMKRTNLVDGVDIQPILGNDMQARLFRKGSLNYPDEIHTYPQPHKGARVAFVEYDIIHDRNLKDLKKSNRNRNVIASREQVGMQEQFIAKVENYLESQK
jgi:glycosyltransferase involved in cell wall biosynthesis